MRTFDLTPLFRSSVGFDNLAHLIDTAQHLDEQTVSYPPYNIEKLGEDSYRITMAVAGFSSDDIDISTEDRTLTITGRARKDEGNAQYLHRGIAGRSFERRFELADYIRVTGASLDNGLLHVELAREVPEALKPRQIPISTQATEPTRIEDKAA